MERGKEREVTYTSKELKSKQVNYLTPNGLEEFKTKLLELYDLRRIKLLEHTDLSSEKINLDNLARDFLSDELSLIDTSIFRLERLIGNSALISQQSDKTHINLGSKVRIIMEGEIIEITIVGTLEANPSKNMISNESPVGKNLLGKTVGEVVKIQIPNNEFYCEILAILK